MLFCTQHFQGCHVLTVDLLFIKNKRRQICITYFYSITFFHSRSLAPSPNRSHRKHNFRQIMSSVKRQSQSQSQSKPQQHFIVKTLVHTDTHYVLCTVLIPPAVNIRIAFKSSNKNAMIAHISLEIRFQIIFVCLLAYFFLSLSPFFCVTRFLLLLL